MRGRFFTDADDASRPGIAVINQTLAKKYFPTKIPLAGGSRMARVGIRRCGRLSAWSRTFAKARSMSRSGLRSICRSIRRGDHSFSLAVRTPQDPAALLPLLVSTLHEIDPDLGVSGEATMSATIDATQAALCTGFQRGWWADLPRCAGARRRRALWRDRLLGKSADAGDRRTHGLGAQRSSVYRLVMRQAGWLTAAGLSIGLVCSVGASISIRKLYSVWRPGTRSL